MVLFPNKTKHIHMASELNIWTYAYIYIYIYIYIYRYLQFQIKYNGNSLCKEFLFVYLSKFKSRFINLFGIICILDNSSFEKASYIFIA